MDQSNYLRVTSVIYPFSGIEFVPRKYLDPAAQRGSQVHYHIQNKISGFETPLDVEHARIEPYLNSFDKFWQSKLHEFVDSKIVQEERLFCNEHQISGQFDCLIQTDDCTYIFDWKTSSKMQEKSWRLQGAAYRYLAEINGYELLDDPVFVKLDRDGKDPILFTCDNYHEDLERFFNCLDIYRYFEMQKRGKCNGN